MEAILRKNGIGEKQDDQEMEAIYAVHEYEVTPQKMADELITGKAGRRNLTAQQLMS